jgi:hypothetical protein
MKREVWAVTDGKESGGEREGKERRLLNRVGFSVIEFVRSFARLIYSLF